MSDQVSGKIRFASYCRPPLEAREYNLEVRQTVTELPGGAGPAVKFKFAVGGPRFALSPADIHSVYPPQGSTGDFERGLPHVVFTRRTIPWERKISADSPLHQPWMALLLFTAEDAKAITIEPRKVRDLFEKLPAGVAGPRGLRCQDYELNDPCNTIDVEAGLFRLLAPSLGDLGYLAHVREVNTDHKETASFLADGSFSVVIGNRFPKAKPAEGETAGENKAVLVSLEGLRDFLPGTQPQDSAKTLRLAVLASWGFHCEKARDFKTAMKKLGETLLPLRLDLPPEGATEAAKYVRAAFSKGYTALNHQTRLGEKTVSWYRGPLTPLNIDVRARYDFKAVPDSLVRYDQTNGLMDLTYAGASQLGRLLALQDRSFAQAISEWRGDVQSQIKARLEKEELRRTLRSQPAGELALQSPESQFLESALTDAMTRTEAAAERPGSSFEHSLKASDEAWRGATMQELPATVREWLARRVLLYGVPFLYLVPDERMLPMPSMRFFRVDPLWIKRLIEGACSVGRNSTEAELVDEMLGDEFFKIAVTGSTQVRRRPPSENGEGSKNGADLPHPTFPFEGFLLRSPVVRGWQGLEMEAWYWKKEGGEFRQAPATPLRIDRLGPDTMLCIFSGPLARIEIREPPEGMHFGADGFEKTTLRNVTAKDPGKQIGVGPGEGELDFRADKALRVVDVAKLANRLYRSLTKSGGMDKNAPFEAFTSAEFGVQMIESPGRVEIEVGAKP